MNTTVLVVVDAQEGYLKESPATRNAIAVEVEKAVASGWKIVVLEMEQTMLAGTSFPGPTIQEVIAAIPGKQFQRATKRTRSGAEQVAANLEGPVKTFRLCGGFVDGCLYATAVGLQICFPGATVEIPVEASFSQMADAWQHLFGLEGAEAGDVVQFPPIEENEVPEMKEWLSEIESNPSAA